MVRIYLYPVVVRGNSPTISTAIFRKGSVSGSTGFRGGGGGGCEILSFVLLTVIVDRSHNTYEHQNAGQAKKKYAAMRFKVFVLPI